MSTDATYSLGLDELCSKEKRLWKATCGEFIGNLILNFFVSGASSQPEDGVFKSLSFGLSLFVAITIVGHLSGGHINPAVTVAMLLSGRVSLIRSIFYIIAQCIGAATGTLAIKALLNEDFHNGLGHTSLADNITEIQGLGIEFFLGLVIVLTFFGAYDANKPETRYLAPFAVGMSGTLGHLGTLRYTGASMNPARSFGTAYATNNWDSHWIYWAGPTLGSIIATILYTQILGKTSSTPSKLIDASDKYRIHAFEREMKKLEKTIDLV